jgi:hypothetical protein
MKRRREELETQSASASGSVLSAEPAALQHKKRLRAAAEVDEGEIGGPAPTADAKSMHSKVPLELSADAVTSGATLATWRLAESRHKGWGLLSIFSQLDLC